MITIPLVILVILFLDCFVLDFYSIGLTLLGFRNVEKKYKDKNPSARFLILVAAHNEEDVIGSTIDNLKKIDYPKNLYDLYIVNDNSTDKTGEICNNKGINQVDTSKQNFAREGVGKSAGIQYALRYLGFEKLKNKYDLIMVLDADNHVDENILREVNSQWIHENKPEAIQVFLDSKNAKSLISIGYTISFYIMNRFNQIPKQVLGFNNVIGGTGFAVRCDWLINTGGFCYKSLVEDLEMSVKILKSGGRVLWNHFTRVYDEKPDTMKISIRQRVRWSKGDWYVVFHNIGSLLKGFIKTGKFKYLDQLLHLFTITRCFKLLVYSIVIAATLLLRLDYYFTDYVHGNQILNILYLKWLLYISISRIVVAIYLFIIIPIYASKKDGKHKINPIKIILGTILFSITSTYANIVGLITCKNQGTWVKTPHSHKKIEVEDNNSLAE